MILRSAATRACAATWRITARGTGRATTTRVIHSYTLSSIRTPSSSFTPHRTMAGPGSGTGIPTSSPSSSPSTSFTGLPASADASGVIPSSPVGLVSGAPEAFVFRKVTIYHPAPSPTQTTGSRNPWCLDWASTTKWLNPLMGWTSSDDTTSQLIDQVTFGTAEEAVEFCKKQGFEWEIVPDHVKTQRKKAYADNYKWKGPPKKNKTSGGSASISGSGSSTAGKQRDVKSTNEQHTVEAKRTQEQQQGKD